MYRIELMEVSAMLIPQRMRADGAPLMGVVAVTHRRQVRNEPRGCTRDREMMGTSRGHFLGSLALSGVLAACGGGGATTQTPRASDLATSSSATTPAASTAAPTTAAVFTGPGALPTGLYAGEGTELDALPAYIQFREDGTGRLLRSGAAFEGDSAEFEFDYRVDDHRLTLSHRTGQLAGCATTAEAIYDWNLEDPGLVLTVARAGCPSVVEGLPQRWRRLEHPLIEWQLRGREPSVVDTPLGTIEWTTTDELVSNVQKMASELVGVRNRDPAIVRSTDGISWTPIPPPPDPPDMPEGIHAFPLLAVRGEVLYASARFGSPDPQLETVYATDDWGVTWREVPMEPDTTPGLLNIAQIVAGNAGVIVTTRDEERASQGQPLIGPIWILGAAGFERVEAPFTGVQTDRIEVWALDSGFFANEGATFSREGIASGASRSWFSADGRRWTEVVDRPVRLVVTAAFGDTVYGVADGAGATDADVVSVDGGRTWTATPERPTAVWPLPMAVGDSGFVTGSGWTTEGDGIGVVWASADGVTWERAMNLWPPVPIIGPPQWANDDTIIFALTTAIVVGRIT
jgi:hypothetical protein